MILGYFLFLMDTCSRFLTNQPILIPFNYG